MTDESKLTKVTAIPAPYGYREDGTPMTQIEASAKQMDDWASRFGFSGSVRMGIGDPNGEPKKWHGVTIGDGPKLPQQPPVDEIDTSELMRKGRARIEETAASFGQMYSDETAPSPQSWLRKLWNCIKGVFSGQAS